MGRSGIDSRRFYTRVRNSYLRPTSLVPDPELELTTEGIAFASGLVSSWTGTDGQVFAPTATAEPVEGSPLLNGRAGMLCPISGGRLEYLPEISSTPTTVYSAEFVIYPENGVGEANREYIYDKTDNSVLADYRAVFPHQANNFSFARMGHFNGTWRYVITEPTHKPQVVTYTMSNGALRIYRNGTLLGIDDGANSVATRFSYNYLGSAYGPPPITEGFRGSIYAVRLWTSTALSSTHVALSATARVAEFGIDDSAYYPSDDPAGITTWVDGRGKRGTGPGGQYLGDELNLWLDNSEAANHMSQGTAGQYPSQGSYINGRYSIRTGTNKWISFGTNWAGICSPGAQKTYDIKAVIRPRSITSTQATAAHLRDCIIMDLSGFGGLVMYNNSGVPTLALYHYDGTTRLISTPITIGEPILVHAWYTGTVLNLRINDGAVQSISGVGNISDLSIPLCLGRGFTTAAYADMDVSEVLIRMLYSEGTASNDRAYLGRIYNIAV